MKTFENITITDAKQLILEKDITLVDIRDMTSYNAKHIDQAIHLTNDNMADFVRNHDLDKPLIVYCFHGHSSQPAAQYLIEQGFEEVYSLIGGYSAWAHHVTNDLA